MTDQELLAHLSIPSGQDTCDAWHFPATSDGLTSPAGRPVVVMAHGLGGTKDSGLQPFAEALAAGGLDVLAFDYRGFGVSSGAPRQTVSVAGQVEDYRAAMRRGRAARSRPATSGALGCVPLRRPRLRGRRGPRRRGRRHLVDAVG